MATMIMSGGQPCVIVEDGGICLKKDAVKVGELWYRKGSEPKAAASKKKSAPPKADPKPSTGG